MLALETEIRQRDITGIIDLPEIAEGSSSATNDAVWDVTSKDVVATVRALRPQLNHEIIEILVPRKTKLYARFVRRLKIVCNVYADYSN